MDDDRILDPSIMVGWVRFEYKFIFFWGVMMQDKIYVRSLGNSEDEMMSALYLQVSIMSQTLIFVTRARSWFFVDRPGFMLVSAFLVAHLVRPSFL